MTENADLSVGLGAEDGDVLDPEGSPEELIGFGDGDEREQLVRNATGVAIIAYGGVLSELAKMVAR